MNDPIKKPNALLLADELKKLIDLHPIAVSAVSDAADELRRQHAENMDNMRRLDEAKYRAEKAEFEFAKEARRAIAFDDIIANHVITMRAAVVAAELYGAADGMKWISNTLFGPGHLPDIEEARELGGAQALWDKETAEHEAFRAAHPAPSKPQDQTCLNCSRVQCAERALHAAGFTLKEGAQEWNPPLGQSASTLLDTIDQLREQVASLQSLCGTKATEQGVRDLLESLKLKFSTPVDALLTNMGAAGNQRAFEVLESINHRGEQDVQALTVAYAQKAMRVKELEAELEAVGAGGVQPVREPMTQDELFDLLPQSLEYPYLDVDMENFARAIERAHGIVDAGSFRVAEESPPISPEPPDNRLKVKLGSQYGRDISGHWFYLQPADEFAEAALCKHCGFTPAKENQPPETETCRWTCVAAGAGRVVYRTKCNSEMHFDDGVLPSDGDQFYCHHCGKKIEIELAKEGGVA